MDDIYGTVKTTEEPQQLAHEVNDVLANSGFEVKECISNCYQL